MEKIRLTKLANEIEQCWNKILQNRAEMGRLIESGEPYSSEKLSELDDESMRLGYLAEELEERYCQVEQAADSDM